MTANQYRAALKRLGLSQRGAARLFGVDTSTSRRWAADGVTGTVVILLNLMVAGKVSAADVTANGGGTSIPAPEQKVRAAGRKGK